jgi:hypothetical protein
LKRSGTYILVATALTFSVLIFQNCTGRRVLSAKLDVSNTQVNSQVGALYTAYSAGSSTAIEGLSSFFDIYKTDGSALFYAEAPGSMGDISTVMPLEFNQLGLAEIPAKIRAYFVVAGASGALLLTSVGGSGTPEETPLLVMAATGNSAFGDFDYALPVSSSSGGTFSLHSYDVANGDLNETIQLEVESLDQDGQWYSLGFLTLTQPE